MPKVKANNITMNYEQQGTGSRWSLFLTWLPITPVMHSKWRRVPCRVTPARRQETIYLSLLKTAHDYQINIPVAARPYFLSA